MIFEVQHSKWSFTWCEPLGPLELMNGHVLQHLREQLEVPSSKLEGSEFLTSEFRKFHTPNFLGSVDCSDDSDFNSKYDEMSNFFSEHGYPDNILSNALHCVQNVIENPPCNHQIKQ